MPRKGLTNWIETDRKWSYFINTNYAVTVAWPASKDIETAHEIALFVREVQDLVGPAVIDHSMGFHSCLFYLNNSLISARAFIDALDAIEVEQQQNPNEDLLIIPLSISDDHALDLESISSVSGLSSSEVIDIFCSATYTVHFQGFLPGFTYIGGLDARLNLPRRQRPRVRVPAGSVAIAAGLIGIYPISSPGGWHIIGKTDIKLFDPDLIPPSRLSLIHI